jgi:NAD(P)-dependent dehydrogenase (short-subunit alcohol dehydrogenase family)
VALIAGASQGIGAALAETFAAAGAAVVIMARREAKLTEIADRIEARGGRVRAVVGDVTDDDAARDAVAAAVASFGRLDVAINNASEGPPPELLADLDPDQFRNAVDVNVNGTYLGMRHQIPAMIDSGGGAIVNFASVAGVGGISHFSSYVAAKAGVIGLTRAAALDYAPFGVRVNVIAPGPIMTEHLVAAGPTAQEGAAASVPIGRVGTTDDIANAVLWLCSDAASYVTGVTLPVDGGQAAGMRLDKPYSPGEPMD